MGDNRRSSAEEDMKQFATLVALFGPKKGSDIYFVFTIIKLVAIAAWLYWCCSD
jgi:hypothetical protein